MQALNDAYGQMFNGWASFIFDHYPEQLRHNRMSFVINYVNEHLIELQQRCIQYNDVFSCDRGSVLVTSYEDMENYIPNNIIVLLLNNLYEKKIEHDENQNLDKEFVNGFKILFLSTMEEAVEDFRLLQV